MSPLSRTKVWSPSLEKWAKLSIKCMVQNTRVYQVREDPDATEYLQALRLAQEHDCDVPHNFFSHDVPIRWCRDVSKHGEGCSHNTKTNMLRQSKLSLFSPALPRRLTDHAIMSDFESDDWICKWVLPSLSIMHGLLFYVLSWSSFSMRSCMPQIVPFDWLSHFVFVSSYVCHDQFCEHLSQMLSVPDFFSLYLFIYFAIMFANYLRAWFLQFQVRS